MVIQAGLFHMFSNDSYDNNIRAAVVLRNRNNPIDSYCFLFCMFFIDIREDREHRLHVHLTDYAVYIVLRDFHNNRRQA